MSKLVTRVTDSPPVGSGVTIKGSRLTNTEVDENFLSLYSNKLELSGGTLTGALYLHAAPSADLQAATKKYVDDGLAGLSSDAIDINFTPAGNIAAVNVQAALQELDTEKLALTGGTLTGSIFGSAVGFRTANPTNDHPVYLSDNAYYDPNTGSYKSVIAGSFTSIEAGWGMLAMYAGTASAADEAFSHSYGTTFYMEDGSVSFSSNEANDQFQISFPNIMFGNNGWPPVKLQSKWGGSTHSYRTMFQSLNGDVDQLTSVGVVPPPAATTGTASFTAYGNPNVDASPIVRMSALQSGAGIVETGHTSAGAVPMLTLRSGLSGTTVLQLDNANNKITAYCPTDIEGTVTIVGASRRIKGDFSNLTQSSRTLFQASATNGFSIVGVIPNGTGATAGFAAYSSSNPDNSVIAQLYATTAEVVLGSTAIGETADYAPLVFQTSVTERMRIDVSGAVSFAGTVIPTGGESANYIYTPTSGLIGCTPSITISENLFWNGSAWKLHSAGWGGLHQLTGGDHKFWTTSASGSAGDSATGLTERFRIAPTKTYSFQPVEVTNGALQVAGTHTPSNGGGTEIHYLAGEGYLQALDRNGTVWKPLKIQGSTLQLRPSNNTGLTVHSGTTMSFGNDSVKPFSGGAIGAWVGSTAGLVSYGNIAYLNSNSYYDGSWKYASTAAAGLLQMSDTMTYYRKASNTVDTVISWDTVFSINATADLTMTGNVTAYSDKRVKEGILPIKDALAKVRQLAGVTFFRKDIEGRKRHMGLLAQDVQPVVPEVVIHDAEKDTYSLAYGNLVALLIEAIKEIDARVRVVEEAAL